MLIIRKHYKLCTMRCVGILSCQDNVILKKHITIDNISSVNFFIHHTQIFIFF